MTSPANSSMYENLRQSMVNDQLRARGIRDERVLNAMARVPRHEFAPERYRDQAYEDHPLPIAEGQTISQPYIVAIMLETLALSSEDKVLEVGTGSGYLTALLAELASTVVSIERHGALADIRIVDVGDFQLELAPYDAIIVSAAAPELPRALVEQLAEGGRMIIPVGWDDSQQLQLIEKRDGQLRTTLRELCRFVPLVAEDRS